MATGGQITGGPRRAPRGLAMRIWDVDPKRLCRRHLLGEHRELHGLWNILTQGKRGYAAHPETRRWEGKLSALRHRHEHLVAEMMRRGYRHDSPLDPALATGRAEQDVLLDPLDQQERLLRAKSCECLLDDPPEVRPPTGDSPAA